MDKESGLGARGSGLGVRGSVRDRRGLGVFGVVFFGAAESVDVSGVFFARGFLGFFSAGIYLYLK
jgi:hypothetical protein